MPENMQLGRMPGAEISHVVLLGDAMGRMPQIREQGPGTLESQLLPDSKAAWRLTLVRADDVINRSPLAAIPSDATHIVITVEGNRAIAASGLLKGEARSYEEVLARLSLAADQFEAVMHSLIQTALRPRLPVAVCTMFLPRHRNPVEQRAASTALAIFNDRIIRQAVEAQLPIADLRTACSEASDQSAQGLLTKAGLTKVSTLIWRALHDSPAEPGGSRIFRY